MNRTETTSRIVTTGTKRISAARQYSLRGIIDLSIRANMCLPYPQPQTLTRPAVNQPPRFSPQPGNVLAIEEGVRLLLAPNPSPMTERGTNTWLLGEGAVTL